MKYYSSVLVLLISFFSGKTIAQSTITPCDLQVDISIGICIDYFCIPLDSEVEGGTPPYHYEWFNGSEQINTGLNYGNDPTGLDTCLTLTVTDAKGCIAVASARYVYEDWPVHLQNNNQFLADDTIVVAHTGGSFDISTNDSDIAGSYKVIQGPFHGDVVMNNDGTGTYSPDIDWCGPDYFRYTATDTGGCRLGRMTTVIIGQSLCAGIYVDKTDCNEGCNGYASFYQQGIFTPPLSYAWSNGSTKEYADALCKGPLSVTVTDVLGNTSVYEAVVESSIMEATISGPITICNGSNISLHAEINVSNHSDYTFYWTGPGLYENLPYDNPTTPYTGVATDSAHYQIHLRSADGCQSTAEWAIEVLPSVFVEVDVEKPQCPGDTLELRSKIDDHFGTLPFSYTWSGPNGIQSNSKDLIWPNIDHLYSGWYYLTVTDVNGCFDTWRNNIAIPDTCDYYIDISDQDETICTGSDIYLFYGMGPRWTIPEKIEWTGPNGFYSTARTPVITNAQPEMSGWYYLQMQFGSTIIIDSALYTIGSNELRIVNLTLIPATDCYLPHDGFISIEMNQPPPYRVRFYDESGFDTVHENPFIRTDGRTIPVTVEIQKGGCSTYKRIPSEKPFPPSFNYTEETCEGNDGSITITSEHALRVSWILPDGTNIWSGPSELTGLSTGTYYATVTDDSTGCTFKDTFYLKPYLDFEVAIIDTPSCTSSDGSLLAQASGNVTPPLTFEWSHGFTGNPATGLSQGGYSVTLTDAEGCSRHENTVLTADEACISQISGHVYINTSCACDLDTTTVIFPFAKICATDGNFTSCVYTSNTGAYYLPLSFSGDYILTATTYINNVQGACTEHVLHIGPDITKDTSGLDFFFCAETQSDLQVAIYCEHPRPGFDFSSIVSVRNNGIWPADTSLLTVKLNPLLKNPFLMPPPLSYDPVTHIAVWKINKLDLYQEFKVKISGTVMAMLGDTFNIEADVVSLYTPDLDLQNNHNECSDIVTGAIDPNDKMVNPLGIGESGNISKADSVLTYIIRFQNTGTDTAFTVVIRDTLDGAVFNLQSVTPLLSSHPYHLYVENENILVFTFDPIHLPDSNRNEKGSHGFVMFNIRLKSDLPLGSKIENAAAIYFDYNLPVITNQAENTIVQTQDIQSTKPDITIMPNPATDEAVVVINHDRSLDWMDIRLFHSSGILVRRVQYARSPELPFIISLDTHDLVPGLYFISVGSDQGYVVKKLVVIAE